MVSFCRHKMKVNYVSMIKKIFHVKLTIKSFHFFVLEMREVKKESIILFNSTKKIGLDTVFAVNLNIYC